MAASIQKKAETPFFDHHSDQEQPFFASNESVDSEAFFSPTKPLSNGSHIQAKLTVGQPDDKYEQEADSVADKVVQRLSKSSTADDTSMPNGNSDINIQRKCAACEAEEETVQRKSSNTEGVASSNIESQLNSSKDGGSPLPDDTRTSMESAMGADFSNVRVHTGSNAVQMSQDLNAQAFTHGSDVYFNEGKYNPSNTEGGRLLAHELTHTVQQGGTTLGSAIQKFGATEHKIAGDEASKAFSDDKKTPLSFDMSISKVPFVLSFGDFTMLSADLFDPRDTITDQNGNSIPNPDSLFNIASKPSSNPGLQLGTQDEIIFAIYDNNKKDARFQKGGIWETLPDIFEMKDPKTGKFLSKDIRKAVNDRYLLLASKNYEHFVQPSGKDLGPLAGLGSSAGGSYRALHEEAILRAYHAGQKGESKSQGLMREAAAQHFLQDSFSAGHLRTPRLSMDKWWLEKYPLFFGNLKKKIALDMARYMNDDSLNGATVFGTVSQIYDDVYEGLQKETKELPPIGFGALLGDILHHNDNELGVWVTNRLGHRWLDYGDGNLNKSFQLGNVDTYKYANNRTPDMIKMAVKLGIEDIQNAYAMGKQSKMVNTAEVILEEVQKKGTDRLNKPTNLYAAEMVVPQLDTSMNNGNITTWQVSTVDELWNNIARTDKSETYGDLITESLEKGEMYAQLTKLADKIDLSKAVYKGPVYLGTLFPQKAYRLGFFKPLQDSPLKGLKAIIDYNPSEGQAFFNEDDAVREEMSKMSKEEVTGFTLKQRADRINNLTDDTMNTVDHDDGELVIQLFETTSHQDRLILYQMVEGHTWEGNWREGWWVNDDDIWNGLEMEQLNRLRQIINAK